MWKISDARDSWATDTGRDLLASSRVGSDVIDFRFRFSAESPSLLSVAHTVSAECDTSLSAYFRLRPKVKFPLSVDLYLPYSYCRTVLEEVYGRN